MFLILKAIRGWLYRKRLHEQQESARKIQSWYRKSVFLRKSRECASKQYLKGADACDSSVTETVSSPGEVSVTVVDTEACKAHGSDTIKKTDVKHHKLSEKCVTESKRRLNEDEMLVVAGLKALAANMVEAVVANAKFQLAGQVGRITYLEAQMGLVSRRRMPRVGYLKTCKYYMFWILYCVTIHREKFS